MPIKDEKNPIPQTKGLYLARRDTNTSWCYVVCIEGEAPFLELAIWDLLNKRFAYDIHLQELIWSQCITEDYQTLFLSPNSTDIKEPEPSSLQRKIRKTVITAIEKVLDDRGDLVSYNMDDSTSLYDLWFDDAEMTALISRLEDELEFLRADDNCIPSTKTIGELTSLIAALKERTSTDSKADIVASDSYVTLASTPAKFRKCPICGLPPQSQVNFQMYHSDYLCVEHCKEFDALPCAERDALSIVQGTVADTIHPTPAEELAYIAVLKRLLKKPAEPNKLLRNIDHAIAYRETTHPTLVEAGNSDGARFLSGEINGLKIARDILLEG